MYDGQFAKTTHAHKPKNQIKLKQKSHSKSGFFAVS